MVISQFDRFKKGEIDPGAGPMGGHRDRISYYTGSGTWEQLGIDSRVKSR